MQVLEPEYTKSPDFSVGEANRQLLRRPHTVDTRRKPAEKKEVHTPPKAGEKKAGELKKEDPKKESAEKKELQKKDDEKKKLQKKDEAKRDDAKKNVERKHVEMKDVEMKDVEKKDDEMKDNQKSVDDHHEGPVEEQLRDDQADKVDEERKADKVDDERKADKVDEARKADEGDEERKADEGERQEQHGAAVEEGAPVAIDAEEFKENSAEEQAAVNTEVRAAEQAPVDKNRGEEHLEQAKNDDPVKDDVRSDTERDALDDDVSMHRSRQTQTHCHEQERNFPSRGSPDNEDALSTENISDSDEDNEIDADVMGEVAPKGDEEVENDKESTDDEEPDRDEKATDDSEPKENKDPKGASPP